MSQQTPEPTPDSPADTPLAVDGSDDPGVPTEAVTDEVETFPRSYVEALRAENARYRTKAKHADDLMAGLTTAYAEQTGRLADPTDLPVSDDLLDDVGLPDRSKVIAAVDELLAKKPHLASTRVTGDVGQGTRGETGAMVSLTDLLRAGAG